MQNLSRMTIGQLVLFCSVICLVVVRLEEQIERTLWGGSHDRGHVGRNQFKLRHENPVEFLMKFWKFARSFSDFVYRQLESGTRYRHRQIEF